jgi:hypothetical protein
MLVRTKNNFVGRDPPAFRQAGDHAPQWCVRGTHPTLLSVFYQKGVMIWEAS